MNRGKTLAAGTLISVRERQIIALVVQGYKNKEIAESLLIRTSTVTSHLRTIFVKLGVSDRVELALHLHADFGVKLAAAEDMPDYLSNRERTDRSRVNTKLARELRYWCGRFVCTEEELKVAVGQVGVSVAKVEEYLRRRIQLDRSGRGDELLSARSLHQSAS